MSTFVPAELPARIGARVVDIILVATIDGLLGRGIGFGVGWLFAAAAIVGIYFVACDVLAGATLGKRLFGLRVVGPDGQRPSLRQAMAREGFMLLGAVPFVGPLLALGAWIWIIVSIRSSPLRQGRHDLLAGGTRVERASE